MDSILQKARFIAQETAKKSQELAKEAAKFSQEIALETAKKSKELAVEATKRADQLKAFAAGDSANSSSASSAAPCPSEADLQVYGITPDLKEYVKTFTMKTFREYPASELICENSGNRQDLTEWQENHAVLVLQVVPEISDFRYVLCPRRMKESLFWKIYFKLVENHIAPYHVGVTHEEKNENVIEEKEKFSSSKLVSIEHDLDAYLMGSHDDDEADDDDGSDFDQLVNSKILDSDGEEDLKTKADASSDGELIEAPSE